MGNQPGNGGNTPEIQVSKQLTLQAGLSKGGVSGLLRLAVLYHG